MRQTDALLGLLAVAAAASFASRRPSAARILNRRPARRRPRHQRRRKRPHSNPRPAPYSPSFIHQSGKWQLEAPAGRGGGAQILVLNQVGNEVSGELGGGRGNAGTGAPVTNELWDGKVSGTSITFYVWRGNDRPAKTFYKGELAPRVIKSLSL